MDQENSLHQHKVSLYIYLADMLDILISYYESSPNYILHILGHVITCPCPRYHLLTEHSSDGPVIDVEYTQQINQECCTRSRHSEEEHVFTSNRYYGIQLLVPALYTKDMSNKMTAVDNRLLFIRHKLSKVFIIQWNLSVTTTSITKLFICDLFSDVF